MMGHHNDGGTHAEVITIAWEWFQWLLDNAARYAWYLLWAFFISGRDWSIITLGGVLRNGFHYNTGVMTISQAESFNANTAFLATSAFSFKKGFSTHSADVVEFKRKLIENSERTIMLMDSSKIDKVAMVSFAHLDDITTLVTDSGIEDSDRERFLSSDDAPGLVIA